MGSINSLKKPEHGGRKLKKIKASLNEKLQNVEWGEYKLGDILEKVETKKLPYKKGDCPNHPHGKYIIPARTATSQNQGLSCYVPKENTTILKNKISVSANGDYCAFWHGIEFTILQDSYALDGKNFNLNSSRALFIISQMNNSLQNKYNWAYKSRWEKLKEESIKLPVKNNSISFDFMESFVAELEAQRLAELEAQRLAELEAQRLAELEAYLSVTGLKDTHLFFEEEQALLNFNKIQWKEFNLNALFGNSTRGKRLKSSDRIKGNLPFVTAGETEEGVSDFIGNNVHIFSKNTTTIDMFGSAKYRDYKYGGDDHIAVVHTERLPKYAAIFLTSAIHKAAHTGKFDYGHNFYAKDADALNVMLPTRNNNPDYSFMSTLISAIHKLVIKDVVAYADKRIEKTKEVIVNNNEL